MTHGLPERRISWGKVVYKGVSFVTVDELIDQELIEWCPTCAEYHPKSVGDDDFKGWEENWKKVQEILNK